MLDLFKDASAQLKSAFKNVAWQENQKQEFLEHTQANTAKLEQEEREVDLELIRLEEGLEMVREEMRLLEEEEKELLDCERKRELGREGEPPKDGNLSAEKKSQVERGRFYNAGSSACVGKENLQTFVGGANKRKIGGDPHRSEPMGGGPPPKAPTPSASVLPTPSASSVPPVRTSVLQPRPATGGSGPVVTPIASITPYQVTLGFGRCCNSSVQCVAEQVDNQG